MFVELPTYLEIYDAADDGMHDMRTGRLLTVEERRDKGYVSFSAWFEDHVQSMIEKGAPWQHAPAFLASALLQHYLQATVRN